MRISRHGFTLIELLMVMVIIGILATVATRGYGEVQRKAYLAELKNDLRSISINQELYFHAHMTYGTLAQLTDFTPSDGVTPSINDVSARGWAATATHDAMPDVECGLFVGEADPSDAGPATVEGHITCSPEN